MHGPQAKCVIKVLIFWFDSSLCSAGKLSLWPKDKKISTRVITAFASLVLNPSLLLLFFSLNRKLNFILKHCLEPKIHFHEITYFRWGTSANYSLWSGECYHSKTTESVTSFVHLVKIFSQYSTQYLSQRFLIHFTILSDYYSVLYCLLRRRFR